MKKIDRIVCTQIILIIIYCVIFVSYSFWINSSTLLLKSIITISFSLMFGFICFFFFAQNNLNTLRNMDFGMYLIGFVILYCIDTFFNMIIFLSSIFDISFFKFYYTLNAPQSLMFCTFCFFFLIIMILFVYLYYYYYYTENTNLNYEKVSQNDVENNPNYNNPNYNNPNIILKVEEIDLNKVNPNFKNNIILPKNTDLQYQYSNFN